MPINGPGIICVGETALISDDSLKGNSELREVRHPETERKSEIYCSIDGQVSDNGIHPLGIRSEGLITDRILLLHVLLLSREAGRYLFFCSSRFLFNAISEVVQY